MWFIFIIYIFYELSHVILWSKCVWQSEKEIETVYWNCLIVFTYSVFNSLLFLSFFFFTQTDSVEDTSEKPEWLEE
jgi:hypothetical protein